jgi:hypothetical protein
MTKARTGVRLAGAGNFGISNSRNPWNALWAMMVGRFMILVDVTIVVVANPTIMAELAPYDARHT